MASVEELKRVRSVFRETDAATDLNLRSSAPELPNYLVKTDFFENLLSGDNDINVVLSIKGSGKSTLVRLFEKEVCQNTENSVLISFNPSDALALEYEQGAPAVFHDRYKKQIAAICLHAFDELSERKSHSGVFKDIKDDIKYALSPIKQIVGDTLSRVESIGYKGFKVNFSNPNFKKIQNADFHFEGAVDLLTKMGLRGLRAFVTFDDPEKMFLDQENYENGLIGLLLASIQMNSQLSGAVNTLVFLRHDVYEKVLSFKDDQIANIHPRKFRSIFWATDELIEVVNERVKFCNLAFDEVFNFSPDEIEGQYKKFLRNGPRDLVFLISEAIEKALRRLDGEDGLVDLKDMKAALPSLFRYSNEQMNREFGDSGNLIPVAKGLFGSKSRKVTAEIGIDKIRDMRLKGENEYAEMKKMGIITNEGILKIMIDSGAAQIVAGKKVIHCFDEEFSDLLTDWRGKNLKAHPCIFGA